MIKYVEIEIGGLRFDIQTGEYMYILNQIQTPGGKRNGVDYMTGYEVDPYQEKSLFIPLTFWFNSVSNMALPLIALNSQNVIVRVSLRNFEDVTIGATDYVPLKNMNLLTDYVMLDVREREQMFRKKHQYLIEQVQYTIDNRTTKLRNNIDLSFKNNVTELIWVVRTFNAKDSVDVESKEWFNFTYKNHTNPIKNCALKLNRQERFADLPGEYFNLVQPYQSHTNIPDNAGICIYSFALFPEYHQPSGSYNFSCINDAFLEIELHDDFFQNLADERGFQGNNEAYIQVYAKSYNILEISDGKATYLFH
jgi:hypothetical protein